MVSKKRLNEIALLQRGLTYNKGDEVPSSSKIVLRSNNIDLDSHSLDLSELKYLREDFVIPEDRKVKKNSIFICMSNGSKQHVGKVAFIDRDMDYAFGGFMGLIVPKPSISAKYVFYACNSSSYRTFLSQIGNGIGITNLRFSELEKFEIPVPSIEEQQRIVDELDLLTGIIDKKNAQLRDLDSLIDALFFEMFGEAENNQKGFPVLSVNDVIEFQGGSQPDKKFFEYEPTDDNVRLIQIRDYKTDRYITYVPKALARRFCTENDIMIGRYGPPIFQILKGISGAYNVALMKAIPKKGNIDFVRVFLRQKKLLHYLESFSRRVAGQDGIQMDKLKAYPFPYPPEALQNSFARQYLDIEEQKKRIQSSLEEANLLLNSRMDYCFRQ